MKNRIKNIALTCGMGLMVLITGCSDPDDEIKTSVYDRLFSPTEVKARVQNKTNVTLSWEEVNGAKCYAIELFANDSLSFAGTAVASYDEVIQNPFVITGLMGEIQYSARIKAIGAEFPESKWTGVFFETDAEQIFKSVDPEGVTAHSVVLQWEASGNPVTKIVLTPGDVTYTLTAEEIASQSATVSDLKEETDYTAKIYNGEKVRGTVKFTTLKDFGNATPVYEGDDLVAVLDAAEEGATIILVSGEFVIGDYALNKSVTVSGYKPSEKPTVYGRFNVSKDVASIKVENLIMRGDVPDAEVWQSNAFEATAGCSIGSLEFTGCEIRNYLKNLLYNNKKAKFGTIIVSNCIVDNIKGDGGDGIDFRGGELGALKVENTTFSNGFRSFLRLQASAAVSFVNCTFYKICRADDSNNTGLFRCSSSGTFTVKNCLFYGTGVKDPANATSGNWCKKGNMKADASYDKNYYFACENLWAGEYTDAAACNATEADPRFKNAENGDFTLGNNDLKDTGAGDPRWY